MLADQAPDTPGLRLNRSRWRYAAAAFGVGATYMMVALFLGFELRVGGRDVTLFGAIVLELTFGLFGFWIGRGIEARGWERLAAAERESRLQQLSELQGRLAQTEKLAVLGQVASAIVHEVRNPLAIIRSLVQTLGDGAKDDGSVRATCRDVVEEIDRLANVTRSLTGLVRRARPRRSMVRAGEVVRRTELLARHLLRGSDVALVVSGRDEPAEVEADADLICQVLLGLVDNARAVSGSGAALKLGSSSHGDVVSFAVADRGPGVPATIRERIFEPFFTTRDEGTGLGLAVARQIVGAHGGSLALDPDHDPGARFVVRLPRGTEARAVT